jgi:hypothetical protein
MLKRDTRQNLGQRLRQIIAFIPGIRVSGYVANRGSDLSIDGAADAGRTAEMMRFIVILLMLR